ncbi:IS66 family transposase [Bifidobacterium longum]|uniref:IS66 family transposase n=1 Tax=Bifidobacterium longum TaxID=216816 RepID=UPI000ABAA0FD|nr:transposase [Bifidobacterium longum]
MRAPQPEPPIPGSFATPSLLAWIVNGKYVMSLPLYRIETDLKACGATISRQDMANWMMNVHARWLAKVHERMKVELLSHVRIHADETTCSGPERAEPRGEEEIEDVAVLLGVYFVKSVFRV